jgi:hypothetical protein
MMRSRWSRAGSSGGRCGPAPVPAWPGCCRGWSARPAGRWRSMLARTARTGCSGCSPRRGGTLAWSARRPRLCHRRPGRPGWGADRRRYRVREERGLPGRGAAAVHGHGREDHELPARRLPRRCRAEGPCTDLARPPERISIIPDRGQRRPRGRCPARVSRNQPVPAHHTANTYVQRVASGSWFDDPRLFPMSSVLRGISTKHDNQSAPCHSGSVEVVADGDQIAGD